MSSLQCSAVALSCCASAAIAHMAALLFSYGYKHTYVPATDCNADELRGARGGAGRRQKSRRPSPECPRNSNCGSAPSAARALAHPIHSSRSLRGLRTLHWYARDTWRLSDSCFDPSSRLAADSSRIIHIFWYLLTPLLLFYKYVAIYFCLLVCDFAQMFTSHCFCTLLYRNVLLEYFG